MGASSYLPAIVTIPTTFRNSAFFSAEFIRIFMFHVIITINISFVPNRFNSSVLVVWVYSLWYQDSILRHTLEKFQS